MLITKEATAASIKGMCWKVKLDALCKYLSSVLWLRKGNEEGIASAPNDPSLHDLE